MQIVHPQILSRFTILSSRLLALQCSNAIKSSSTPPHYSNRVFTISQTYIFNIHIPVQAKKFNIFLARARTKIPLIMHQNTPFQVKNSIFYLGRGLAPPNPSPVGAVPLPTLPFAHTKPSGSASSSPRIAARFTPLTSVLFNTRMYKNNYR